MKSRFGLILVVVILFSQLAALAVVPSVKAQAALSPSALPSIALSGIPRQVAINTKTNTLYVAQSPADGTTNETLSIINGNTNSIVTIDIGTGFEAMAVNEATNQVYVSNGFGGLYVRDGQTGAIVDTIGMTRPKTIAVNPDNNRIYVLDNELLKVLDANTHTVISDPVSVGFASYISAINTKSMKLYAAYNDGTGVDRLRVFDITPVTPVEVSGPLGILPYNDGYLKGAVDTQNNIVYVANTDTNVIYVIDGSDNHIIDTITYPYGLDTATGKYQRSLPNDIAFDSTTNKLLVGTTNETFTPNSNPPDNVVYQTFEIRGLQELP
jgi:DNA-binding beta-propeller fold protein YncE